MSNASIKSQDLPEISRIFDQIKAVEDDVERVTTSGTFGATLGGRYVQDEMPPEDRYALTRLILATSYRKIDLLAQRAVSLGVSIDGYESMDAWIEARLPATMPDSRPDVVLAS